MALVASPVHPRVCGERVTSNSDIATKNGSSPRLRGTRIGAERGEPRRRFIPAFAGNAKLLSCPPASSPVHPRVCGERYWSSPWMVGRGGSSPRLRGTPATVLYARLRYAVHPRVCGERDRGFSSAALVMRFIPAFAGNARASAPRICTTPVHPRVCGERTLHADELAICGGSSPRLRGTLRDRLSQRHQVRFIPAFAGNAECFCTGPTNRAVHPRVCGERVISLRTTSRCSGSSPRLRGTLRTMQYQIEELRFIPAFAGNARGDVTAGEQFAVHPRVCGERKLP